MGPKEDVAEPAPPPSAFITHLNFYWKHFCPREGGGCHLHPGVMCRELDLLQRCFNPLCHLHVLTIVMYWSEAYSVSPP